MGTCNRLYVNMAFGLLVYLLCNNLLTDITVCYLNR